MKYTYAYKTSEGKRLEASTDASSRDAVFETLRAQGIRPIKVVAEDGSKANGEMHGVRKRVVAALVLLAATIVGAFAWLIGERTGAATATNSAVSAPRHQIYGDPAIVSGFERGEFGNVLPRDGDRLLAIFAQPGKLMCAKGADVRTLSGADAILLVDYAKSTLATEHDVAFLPGDSREVRELKQIVNGMREELREYLANGNGTVQSYWRRLNERTQAEMRIYERTKRELENETSEEAWEQKNDALRRLGLRTIPNPND